MKNSEKLKKLDQLKKDCRQLLNDSKNSEVFLKIISILKEIFNDDYQKKSDLDKAIINSIETFFSNDAKQSEEANIESLKDIIRIIIPNNFDKKNQLQQELIAIFKTTYDDRELERLSSVLSSYGSQINNREMTKTLIESTKILEQVSKSNVNQSIR